MASLNSLSLKQAKNFPFNFLVNMIDGGFFGMALGFASFTTIVALFVSNLTNSAVLIGLIPAIHVVGWQLPQLFTAHRVSKLTRFKPMVMFFTLHERLPFLGLAAVAWFLPQIGSQTALLIIFGLLVWQGIGGGLAANPWQNLIGKIIYRERWGLFFGSQSAISSLLSSVGVAIAGMILENSVGYRGFTLCFLLAVACFTVSYIAIGLTREEESPPISVTIESQDYWREVREILRRDPNFRWFVVVRVLAQLGTVGFIFYTVYVVRFYHADEATAGILAAVLLVSQTIFNPILGWLGDHWSHRGVMAVGMMCAAASALIAILAPSVAWFYPANILVGIAYVGVWTIALAMTLEFGKTHEKPAYIGLANTLIAPTAILIPLFAGWLADAMGYKATFLATAIGAIATMIVLIFILEDHPKNVAIES